MSVVTVQPPGYYVSAISGERRWLVDGPYPTHQDALLHVDRVRDDACSMDPRTRRYAWGTARVYADGEERSRTKRNLPLFEPEHSPRRFVVRVGPGGHLAIRHAGDQRWHNRESGYTELARVNVPWCADDNDWGRAICDALVRVYAL